MGQQLRRLVPLLRIATNPQRFNGDDRPPQPTIDLLFTCSYWQAERDIVAALSSLPDAYRVALCACALASQVDIFTSTDDLLLKKCHKVVGQLNAQRPAEALAILEEWYED